MIARMRCGCRRALLRARASATSWPRCRARGSRGSRTRARARARSPLADDRRQARLRNVAADLADVAGDVATRSGTRSASRTAPARRPGRRVTGRLGGCEPRAVSDGEEPTARQHGDVDGGELGAQVEPIAFLEERRVREPSRDHRRGEVDVGARRTRRWRATPCVVSVSRGSATTSRVASSASSLKVSVALWRGSRSSGSCRGPG